MLTVSRLEPPLTEVLRMLNKMIETACIKRGSANLKPTDTFNPCVMTIIQPTNFISARRANGTFLNCPPGLRRSAYGYSVCHATRANLSSPYEQYFPSRVVTERRARWLRRLQTAGRMMYSLEARRKMATLIANVRPDLCHVHNIYTQLSPSILPALADKRVPTVMTVHDYHLVSPHTAHGPTAAGLTQAGSGSFEAPCRVFTAFVRASFCKSRRIVFIVPAHL